MRRRVVQPLKLAYALEFTPHHRGSFIRDPAIGGGDLALATRPWC